MTEVRGPPGLSDTKATRYSSPCQRNDGSASVPTEAWIEDWLSVPRFAVYLAAAGGDRTEALRLFEWNAQLSAALAHDVAHFEVGLRNAYDRALAAHLGLAGHWTAAGEVVFAPVLRVKKRRTRSGFSKTSVDINSIPRSSLERAIREAGGSSAPPGKVVAQLTFGFWRYLTSAAHEVALWRPALHHAFPAGTNRGDVDVRIGRVHELRNRIAHHEPLLALDISAIHDDLLDVAGLINPELRDYIKRHSVVLEILERRSHPSPPEDHRHHP